MDQMAAYDFLLRQKLWPYLVPFPR